MYLFIIHNLLIQFSWYNPSLGSPLWTLRRDCLDCRHLLDLHLWHAMVSPFLYQNMFLWNMLFVFFLFCICNCLSFIFLFAILAVKTLCLYLHQYLYLHICICIVFVFIFALVFAILISRFLTCICCLLPCAFLPFWMKTFKKFHHKYCEKIYAWLFERIDIYWKCFVKS